MIKITVEKASGHTFELWQEGGVHWAAGTVLDALLSEEPTSRITIDPHAEHPPRPFG